MKKVVLVQQPMFSQASSGNTSAVAARASEKSANISLSHYRAVKNSQQPVHKTGLASPLLTQLRKKPSGVNQSLNISQQPQIKLNKAQFRNQLVESSPNTKKTSFVVIQQSNKPVQNEGDVSVAESTTSLNTAAHLVSNRCNSCANKNSAPKFIFPSQKVQQKDATEVAMARKRSMCEPNADKTVAANSKDLNQNQRKTSPMHIHYHNHNYIKVVNVPSPTNSKSPQQQPQTNHQDFASSLQAKLTSLNNSKQYTDSIESAGEEAPRPAAVTREQDVSPPHPKQQDATKQAAQAQILNTLSNYISLNNPQFQQNRDGLVMDNLKEFLSYLEKKGIINITQLENNQEQMQSLVQDLLKLDLNKFSSHSRTTANSASASANSTAASSSAARPQSRGRRGSTQSTTSVASHRRQGTPVNNSGHISSGNESSASNFQKRRSSICSDSNNGHIHLNINGQVNNLSINPIVQPTAQNQAANTSLITPSAKETAQRRGSDSQIIQKLRDKQIFKNYQQKVATGKPRQSSAEQRPSSGKKDQMVNPKAAFIRKSSANPSTAVGSSVERSTLKKKDSSTDYSTGNVSSSVQSLSSLQINEQVMQEREKVIKYNKLYFKKHKTLPPTQLEMYKFVKLIGKGAFGRVTLGIHKLTGKQVAIKTIDKACMKDEFSKKKVFQEVFILKKIRHSNIIRLLEVFESQKHFLIVMEHAGGGDFLQYVKEKKRLGEEEAKVIFKHITYGLAQCHCRSVLHRDVKLDNILMDGSGGVKICDFGVSRLMKKGQVIKEQCGTPAYLAPEIIADEGYEGFYVDIWSLGVLLYAVLCGTVPFKAQNLPDLHKLILQGNFNYPVQISAEAKNLIERMLVLVPQKRISIPEILNHPWLKEGGADEANNDLDLETGLSFSRQECMGAVNPFSGVELNEEDRKSGNINFVNVDNLFYNGQSKSKLSYADYCAVTEDYYTQHIDEEALRVLETFGFPRAQVLESLKKGEMNHATASYNLLILP